MGAKLRHEKDWVEGRLLFIQLQMFSNKIYNDDSLAGQNHNGTAGGLFENLILPGG
jgi:hypothetical protein